MNKSKFIFTSFIIFSLVFLAYEYISYNEDTFEKIRINLKDKSCEKLAETKDSLENWRTLQIYRERCK